MDFCYPLSTWSFAVHTACASVAFVCLFPAVYFGYQIQHRLIFMTPTLCFALAYENLLLVVPNTPFCTLSAQRFGWIMNAVIPPLFLVASFETGYAVHKHRSVKYLGINFDEGKRVDTAPCSWFLRNLVRLIALALFFMGLIVNFSVFFPDASDNAGMSGYLGLGRGDVAHYYVSIVPSLVFSLVTLVIAATIKRYGRHSTLLIPRSCGWNWLLLGSLLQSAGQFPASTALYPSTSMAGQVVLLISLLLTHRLVLLDMGEAAKITEFLRRQKAVQQRLAVGGWVEGARRGRKDGGEAGAEGGREGGQWQTNGHHHHGKHGRRRSHSHHQGGKGGLELGRGRGWEGQGTLPGSVRADTETEGGKEVPGVEGADEEDMEGAMGNVSSMEEGRGFPPSEGAGVVQLSGGEEGGREGGRECMTLPWG